METIPEWFASLEPFARMEHIIWWGIEQLNAKEQQDRIDAGRALGKVNPYISDIGQCDRLVVKSLLGHPETNPTSPDEEITFLVGHAFEEALAKILEGAGATVIREQRTAIPVGETEVTGRYDIFVHIPALKALLELKTTTVQSYRITMEKGHNGDPKHQRQINAYGYAARQGLLTGEVVDFEHLFLVYLLKDVKKRDREAYVYKTDRGKHPKGTVIPGVNAVNVHEVLYDEESALEDLDLLAHLDSLAKQGIVPEIPEEYTQKDFPCGWCRYQDDCWARREA